MSEVKSSNKTVVMFDWDDTWFATTHILNAKIDMTQINDIKDISDEKTREHIIDIEKMMIGILEKYKESAKFYIVTNASMTWITLCLICYPNLAKIVGEKVQILSAKDRYAECFPEDFVKWKHFLYTEIVHYENADHIIGFGDSIVDREAIKLLKKSDIMVKSIKLVDKPTSEQIVKQITLLVNCFDYIYSQKEDLDLQIVITTN